MTKAINSLPQNMHERMRTLSPTCFRVLWREGLVSFRFFILHLLFFLGCCHQLPSSSPREMQRYPFPSLTDWRVGVCENPLLRSWRRERDNSEPYLAHPAWSAQSYFPQDFILCQPSASFPSCSSNPWQAPLVNHLHTKMLISGSVLGAFNIRQRFFSHPGWSLRQLRRTISHQSPVELRKLSTWHP